MSSTNVGNIDLGLSVNKQMFNKQLNGIAGSAKSSVMSAFKPLGKMIGAVLGGAAVMMFSSIVVSGIQLITKTPLTARNLTIVSVALGVGYGMGANTGILANMPQFIRLIFGGSGIVPAAFVAIILNVLLPKEKQEA